MKKIVAGLILALGSISANANVLCNVVTKDPRYHVSSYVRSQTACVTTTHAGASSAGAQLARLGLVVGLFMTVEFLADQYVKSTVEEIVNADYKIVSCNIKHKEYNFLVGKERMVNKETTKVYKKASEGIYKSSNLANFQLNVNAMEFSGSSWTEGTLYSKCYIKEETRNGVVGQEFLIVTKWEDSNTDTFKVFAKSSAQAIDMVKEKFANSSTKVVDVYYNLMAVSKTAIDFQ
jgi:hypothetical protein